MGAWGGWQDNGREGKHAGWEACEWCHWWYFDLQVKARDKQGSEMRGSPAPRGTCAWLCPMPRNVSPGCRWEAVEPFPKGGRRARSSCCCISGTISSAICLAWRRSSIEQIPLKPPNNVIYGGPSPHSSDLVPSAAKNTGSDDERLNIRYHLPRGKRGLFSFPGPRR